MCIENIAEVSRRRSNWRYEMKNAIKRSAVWKVKKARQAHAKYVEETPIDVRIKRIENAYWYVAVLALLAIS